MLLHQIRGPLAGALVACALGMALAALGSAGPANAAPATTQSDAAINASLDALAKSLAASLGDADLRSTIHNAVEKRFDGDEDALWSSLASVPTFSSKVAGRSQSGAAAADLAAKLPQLQIAVPVHFDSWDPATYRPLVAYFPQGVDDTKVKTLTAYDAAGRAVQVDAQQGPQQPLIVVGLNERTDEAGKLLPAYAPAAGKDQTAQSSSQAVTAAASTYSVDITKVALIDDKEPSTLGDAEIAMRAKSKGCSGTDYSATNWESVNNSGDQWYGSRNLGLTQCDVVFYWWEDDGGAFDFTLSYGGFSLGTKMDNSDDLIGGKQLPYSSFAGSTNRTDEWPALTMRTQ